MGKSICITLNHAANMSEILITNIIYKKKEVYDRTI